MDATVEELSAVAMNQLVNVKELYRTFYRAQHMGKDTSDLQAEIGTECQKLRNYVMIWGYAAEREYLEGGVE